MGRWNIILVPNVRDKYEILKDGNVEWVDGTLSWYPMSEINNSFPMQLAEYAIANDLQVEPEF
jgi:hypothetical protein